jgi:hypothetical protein
MVGGDFDWHFPKRSGPRIDAPLEALFEAPANRVNSASASGLSVSKHGEEWHKSIMHMNYFLGIIRTGRHDVEQLRR